MPVSDRRLERAAAVSERARFAHPAHVARWHRLHADAELPARGTPHAAGYDLKAYLLGSPVQMTQGPELFTRHADTEAETPFIALMPGQRAVIPTGLRVALPESVVMDVRPRSGTSLRKGLEIVNAPGTIDEDYRGEVGIIVKNATSAMLFIEHGERIAQVVFLRVEHPFFEDADALDETERGNGAFGSTGVK